MSAEHCYIKLDVTHPDYAAAIATLRAHFAKDYPDNVLSIEANDHATIAWVKCVMGHGVEGAVVFDEATKADHSTKVSADMDAADW